MRVFLTPQDARFSRVWIVCHRLLNHRSAGFQDGRLSFDLGLKRSRHEAKRIEVLGLGTGAECVAVYGHDGDVCVTAKTALFHIAICDACVSQRATQFLQVGHGLIRRMQVRAADDFEQGCPGAVEVNQAEVDSFWVNDLSRVFFQVRSHDVDFAWFAFFRAEFEVTIATKRAGQTVKSDSPWGGQGRSSSCGRTLCLDRWCIRVRGRPEHQDARPLH